MPEQQDRQQIAETLREHPQPSQPGEVSELARHGDPSLRRRKDDLAYTSPTQTQGRGGIAWVRTSELLTSRGMGIGSSFGIRQESGLRRLRTSLNPVSRHGIAHKSATAAPLPPVTAFGAAPPSSPAAPSQGIGR